MTETTKTTSTSAAPSFALTLTAQKSSVTDTARKTAQVASEILSSHVIQIGGKSFLIWATAVAGNQTVTVSASKRDWEHLGEQIKADGILSGTETEETTLQVENDQLTVSANKTQAVKQAQKTVAALKTFQQHARYETTYKPPTASSTATPLKNTNFRSSVPQRKTSDDPIEDAIFDLEYGQAIEGTTLLTALTELENNPVLPRKIKILAPQNNVPNRAIEKVTWETEASSNISAEHLLENCVLPQDKNPYYIPIRISGSSHYVGLFIEGGKAHYYDSKGRPYTHDLHNGNEPTALAKQINAFCKKNSITPPDTNSQYIVTGNKTPHQPIEDHVHCGIYQFAWYGILLLAKNTNVRVVPSDPEIDGKHIRKTRTEMIELLKTKLNGNGQTSSSSTQSSPQNYSTNTKNATGNNNPTRPVNTATAQPPKSGVTIEDVTDEDAEPSSGTTNSTTNSTLPATARTMTSAHAATVHSTPAGTVTITRIDASAKPPAEPTATPPPTVTPIIAPPLEPTAIPIIIAPTIAPSRSSTAPNPNLVTETPDDIAKQLG